MMLPRCIRLFAGADAENTARLASLENGDGEVGFFFAFPF